VTVIGVAEAAVVADGEVTVGGSARISRKRVSISSFSVIDELCPPAAGTHQTPMKESEWSPPVLGGEWTALSFPRERGEKRWERWVL
jgi:hypothetical protein